MHDNLHRLPSPGRLKQELPLPAEEAASILRSRQTIERLLSGEDRRHLVIVGPCSLHDDTSAEEFCAKLLELKRECEDSLFFVMRAYVEKARTSTGWKGLISDPHLDGSFSIEEGLIRTRLLLLKLVQQGLPLATEFLDPFLAPYYADFMSWGCIGARTSSSQIHRQLASSLSIPIGFKNSVEGDIAPAVLGMVAARQPQGLLSLTEDGHIAKVLSKGNSRTHLILRGSKEGPNYSSEKLEAAEQLLMEYQLPRRILIDCSHDNSGKNPLKQMDVARSTTGLRTESFLGIMLESHLYGGQQALKSSGLQYGVSVTDGCLSWEETKKTLLEFAETVSYLH